MCIYGYFMYEQHVRMTKSLDVHMFYFISLFVIYIYIYIYIVNTIL